MHSSKRYIHKAQIIAGIVFLGGGWFFCTVGWGDGNLDQIIFVSLSILSGSLGLFSLVSAYTFRFEPDIKSALQGTNEAILIEAYCLRRHQHYLFGAASIVAQPVMQAVDISEVRLVFPTHVVLHGREVIFLQHTQREALHQFALRNSIPISQRLDIWDMVTHPFLDVETSPEEHEQLFQQLENQGVSRAEVEEARRKVKTSLTWTSVFSMEWISYDHLDVLRSCSPLWGRKKFYWYTMELALRNFSPSNAE